jgi:pyruvate kinase
MLESMTENPIQTRAEVSDVANAIFDGTSVVMLSGETAAGMFPEETLIMMIQVIGEAEASIDYEARFDSNVLSTIIEASVITSFKINAKAIIVPTR